MRFSWKGLLLAPLPIPALFSGAFAGSVILDPAPGQNPLLAFLIVLAPGCFVSYGATIFLLLPSLYLLSKWRQMTWLSVSLLGAALGLVVFVPLTVLIWSSSGPDSGPPVENFFVFFYRWAADPLVFVFPASGGITAALYWWLATRQEGGSSRSGT